MQVDAPIYEESEMQMPMQTLQAQQTLEASMSQDMLDFVHHYGITVQKAKPQNNNFASDTASTAIALNQTSAQKHMGSTLR